MNNRLYRTTPTIAATIEDLRRQLRDEYGLDFSFRILARGIIIAADNAVDGVLLAQSESRTIEPDARD